MTGSEHTARIDAIDALLPQTQCQRCEYDACRPYAEAIANGDAINKCPPGGEETIQALAELLDVPAPPLDRRHGEPGPRQAAFIREDECIGCTKCIQACPTDAILGAAKQMHTVIESECTGCELCIPPCPVDCIDMIAPRHSDGHITPEQSQYWKGRHEDRQERLKKQAAQRERDRRSRLALREDRRAAADGSGQSDAGKSGLHFKTKEAIRSEIDAAVARARARKATGKGPGES